MTHATMSGTFAPQSDPLVAAGIPLTITCVADALPLTQFIEANVPPEQRAVETGPTGALCRHVGYIARHEEAVRRKNEPLRVLFEHQVLHGYPFAVAAVRAYLAVPGLGVSAVPPASTVSVASRPSAPSPRTQKPGFWIWQPSAPSMPAADGATPLSAALQQPRRIPLTIDDGMQATALGALIDAAFDARTCPKRLALFSDKVLALVQAEIRRDQKTFDRLEAEVRGEYTQALQLARLALEAPPPDRDGLAKAYLRQADSYREADEDAQRTETAANEVKSDAETVPAVQPRPGKAATALRSQPAPTVGTVQIVPVGDVHVGPERRRRADLDHVATLAESITASGLNHPIVVTPKRELVAGLHRLLAHEKLGLKNIAVYVRDIEGQQKRLAEIDENLVRRVLPALELAELTSERKQLYELLHPETRQHRRGGAVKASQAATAFSAVAQSFAAETAKKMGVAERTIRQYAQVAGIAPAAREAVRSTPVAGRINELVALARVPVGEQVAVARIISEGKAKRVSDACELLHSETGPTVPYAVTQGPVVQRQHAAVKRLHGDLLATASDWRRRDPLGMKALIDYNDALVDTLTDALKAAPTEVPAEACRCGGRSSCTQCGGRGWLPAKA
jgi:ParB family chromosome partitioning protein